MAKVIDYRRTEVYINETCAYNTDYDCQDKGKNFLILEQNDKILFVLVCAEHTLNYLREGWEIANPDLFCFEWDNPVRIKEVENGSNE